MDCFSCSDNALVLQATLKMARQNFEEQHGTSLAQKASSNADGEEEEEEEVRPAPALSLV